MQKLIGGMILVLGLWASIAAAQGRVFSTGFETFADFDRFYIVPQNYRNTSSHELSSEQVYSGEYAHKGWIYGANERFHIFRNNIHRGYPTVQLFAVEGGAFKTPVEIKFWVWVDIDLALGEWLSFATLDHTLSDQWDAVLVNLDDQGFVHLNHVPFTGRQEYSFQTNTEKFPMREWVELSIRLHFDENEGFAEVRQNGVLVSSAPVRRGNGLFTQAHFGLFAAPTISSGVIYNDNLTITELVDN